MAESLADTPFFQSYTDQIIMPINNSIAEFTEKGLNQYLMTKHLQTS